MRRRKGGTAPTRRLLIPITIGIVAFGILLTAALTGTPTGPLGPDRTGTWDVIVVGSEPEGISAAVAAAESGARTLLITEDARVGGLFVLGEMNSLDLRTQPFNYHQGLFERWWEGVGRRHSFDVTRAETTFLELLHEARVNVRLKSAPLAPLMEAGKVVGVREGAVEHRGRQVIDATAEMHFAAAAGATYTVGWESLGLNERMVDTLVFSIEGVDWSALRRGIRERGPGYAAEDDWVAWGHFGGYPAAYQAIEEGIRLRGLNLGRQEDGTLLVNALLIYGIDPFDPTSIEDGIARAAREAPRIVEYLAQDLPGFEHARLAGVAPQLYVRESRHLTAECVLTGDDVLDNRVGPLDIAAGGYPLDVQTLTPTDDGYVFGFPEIFGIPLCVTVPVGVTNLWVVGKAAGYDPIAASSVRVVPVGMTVGEAAGVAAARSAKAGISPHEFSASVQRLQALRGELQARGAYLPEVAHRTPVGPHDHEHYEAYRLLLSRGLAVGGYANDPRLDEPVAAISYVYLLSNVGHRFHGTDALGEELVKRFPASGPLLPEVAREITEVAICALLGRPGPDLLAEAVPPFDSSLDERPMSRGEMYSLAGAIAAIELETGGSAGEVHARC